jgi:hypothetical protein
MARIVTLLVTGLFLAGCATPLVLDEDGALAVIPHRVSDTGHILVETMVNGQGPFEFALDTGASISVVYEKTARETGIEATFGQQIHVLGMTGSGFYPLAHALAISVGSESWRDARIAILPGSTNASTRVDGILGVDFLSQYAVHHSQGDRVVRLYPADLVAERSYLGWHSIPLFDMRVGNGDVTVMAFDVHVEGWRIPTVFDLGASVNLMNRRAARLLNIPIRRTRNIPQIHGVTGKVPVTTKLIVWRLGIADMYWRHRVFFIGDFPIFDVLDIGKRPVAIAGTDLFQERDFIIEFVRKRLLVGKQD